MVANGMTPAVLDKIFERGAANAVVHDRPDGGKEMIIPDGYRAHTLPPLDKPLTRIRQAVTFYDLESFIAYVNRYKSDASRVFAMPGHLSGDKRAAVKAILDYHKPAAADYGAHIAVYHPRYSEPWQRWTSAPAMLQADFAEFIEENRADIRKPDAAILLDIVSKFKATKKVDYDSVMHQPNGDILVMWSDKTENNGKPGVHVPTELELGIPVFFKGALYAVTILMRYKLNNGALTFRIKPDRADYVEQAAFDEIAKAISDGTGIECYLGVAA